LFEKSSTSFLLSWSMAFFHVFSTDLRLIPKSWATIYLSAFTTGLSLPRAFSAIYAANL
jgi:hypothetical protein